MCDVQLPFQGREVAFVSHWWSNFPLPRDRPTLRGLNPSSGGVNALSMIGDRLDSDWSLLGNCSALMM